jgi:hypothetical protein
MATNKDTTPVTVHCLERFYHKDGRSIAISLAINEDLVFLPLEEIQIHDTGVVESEKRVVNVVMPMWLAQEKRLA